MTRTITTTGVACRALFRSRADWDVTSPLTDIELDGLRVVDGWRRYVTDWTAVLERDLARLLVPIDAVIGIEGAAVTGRWETRRLLLHAMLEHRQPPGQWSRAQWVDVVASGSKAAQQAVLRVAYVVGDQHDVHRSFRRVNRRQLVQALFGADDVAASLNRINAHLATLGGAPAGASSLSFGLRRRNRSSSIQR